jgi:hypothetical protein
MVKEVQSYPVLVWIDKIDAHIKRLTPVVFSDKHSRFRPAWANASNIN